jgi:hypothetical protein
MSQQQLLAVQRELLHRREPRVMLLAMRYRLISSPMMLRLASRLLIYTRNNNTTSRLSSTRTGRIWIQRIGCPLSEKLWIVPMLVPMLGLLQG